MEFWTWSIDFNYKLFLIGMAFLLTLGEEETLLSFRFGGRRWRGKQVVVDLQLKVIDYPTIKQKSFNIDKLTSHENTGITLKFLYIFIIFTSCICKTNTKLKSNTS